MTKTTKTRSKKKSKIYSAVMMVVDNDETLGPVSVYITSLAFIIPDKAIRGERQFTLNYGQVPPCKDFLTVHLHISSLRTGLSNPGEKRPVITTSVSTNTERLVDPNMVALIPSMVKLPKKVSITAGKNNQATVLNITSSNADPKTLITDTKRDLELLLKYAGEILNIAGKD